MQTYALSAVGADRPGIIAAIADRLVTHGLNVTDSQMGILRGHFAMTLVLESEHVDEDALRADLAGATEELHLEALSLRQVNASPPAAARALNIPTHVVSVYGADHPGILAAVTAALAAAAVNVCDLRTRLVSDDAVYMMMVDVAVPAGGDEEAVRASLETVGEQQGVDVSLRAADVDEL